MEKEKGRVKRRKDTYRGRGVETKRHIESIVSNRLWRGSSRPGSPSCFADFEASLNSVSNFSFPLSLSLSLSHSLFLSLKFKPPILVKIIQEIMKLASMSLLGTRRYRLQLGGGKLNYIKPVWSEGELTMAAWYSVGADDTHTFTGCIFLPGVPAGINGTWGTSVWTGITSYDIPGITVLQVHEGERELLFFIFLVLWYCHIPDVTVLKVH